MTTTHQRHWHHVAGILLVAALAACGTDDPNTASPSDSWQAFEEYLEEQADELSGAVLVAKDGEPRLQEAFGLADRETGQPNDVDTRFNLGSVGKMFTGVAVAQLVSSGELAFDDTVGEHLDGFPAAIADQVTVDQLLTHTSGMGDFMRGRYPEEAKAADTATDLLPLITGEPLLFEPGTREGYSNSGYVVLGAIIEAVSGQSYYDYVREHIFEPAGMPRTNWFPPGEDTDNTATGYMASGGTGGAQTLPSPRSDDTADDAGSGGELVENSEVVPWGNPSGGVYSTVGDLLRFSEALLEHELLSAETTDIVLTGKVPMSSGSARLAYGFVDGTTNGVRTVGHSGGAPGVGASFDVYPDLDFVVVILANQEDVIEPLRQKTREVLGTRT